MKALLLYRPNSEHATLVEDYLRDFKMQTGKTLQVLDVDSPEGSEMCRLYDIMEYPAILVIDNEGRQQAAWTGQNLPRFGEVSYYVTDDQRTRSA
jgi:hypothetical protein